MRTISFRAKGGPHDGDLLSMPAASVPVSKSMMLQDHKQPMGVLSKYFFNKVTMEAVYQGPVTVNPDQVGQ
jgi:hypothetical protein